jgi:riboflavin synthase
MFTGIIEELGEVRRILPRGRVTLLEISAQKVAEGLRAGDSVAVNGACLTLVKREDRNLSFEAMPETLKLTNLGALKIKEKVNLERALELGKRLSGHFVYGHIDCLGTVRRKGYAGGNLFFEIAVPPRLMKYIIPKGSVAVDGVSLTIVEKKSSSFRVYIIPHTLQNTTLGTKGPSALVNIEFDILAKRA